MDILVIYDKEPLQVQEIKQMLKDRNKIETISFDQEVSEEIRNYEPNSFDLIFIKMKKQDSLRLLREVNEFFRDALTVAISIFGQRDLIDKAYEQDLICDHLDTPFHETDMMLVMKRVQHRYNS